MIKKPSSKIIDYLYGLERFGIKPGLERMEKLLSALGDPHRRYPSIIVGGTNGKGSVSAMLAAVFTEAGFKAGLYTSPHLVRFNERIRVGSRLITDNEIVKTASLIKRSAVRAGVPDEITFFEFTTAMAFEYFRQKKVDIAVLEVGMGGRLDATNVVDPAVSIITTVSMDHMAHLGSDLESIAAEKAGIIKDGGMAISGEEKRLPAGAIERRARSVGAELYRLGKDFKKTGDRGRIFDYHGIGKDLKGISLSLPGTHQHKNAACAIAALELLNTRWGLRIPVRSIRAGLKKTLWPGRVDVVNKKPLVILDCAHNPDGARTLKLALKEFSFKRLFLILGIMADKDIDGIVKVLAPLAHTVIITAPGTTRAAGIDTLRSRLEPYAKKPIAEASVREACRYALTQAGSADAICVTGSIFTVGEARSYLSRIFSL